ncbi:hypothetical protein NUBL22018_35720 [Klebsiella variicola]|uniref:hypothetical protein n=1 Tax=Klebsiella variicola TaxID=244366 RepID=UPI0021817DB2|nr:hypothetical protein [Klebsiella variicola]GKI46724.1 hypothetical protein NUBL22018_35720 [Klebsiella variicola]HCI8843172.1 hypothetical protein [Klebsiella variicola]
MEKITDVLKELEKVTCRELAVYFDLTPRRVSWHRLNQKSSGRRSLKSKRQLLAQPAMKKQGVNRDLFFVGHRTGWLGPGGLAGPI